MPHPGTRDSSTIDDPSTLIPIDLTARIRQKVSDEVCPCPSIVIATLSTETACWRTGNSRSKQGYTERLARRAKRDMPALPGFLPFSRRGCLHVLDENAAL